MEEKRGEFAGGGAESLLTVGPGGSVTVTYHEQFGPHDDVVLLEASDDALLSDLLLGRVTVRGRPEEEAVLCSNSSTYAMKFVGTSNSMFLIPPGNPNPNPLSSESDPLSSVSVLKVAPGCIELVRTAPRLDKLRSILKQRLYKLEEEEEELEGGFGKEGLYTWRDLIGLVQASDEELREGLRALSAVEINGFWRIVDKKSINNVLNMVLTNSVLHDWPLNALVETEVLSVMESDGFNSTIVKHCLEIFGSRVQKESEENKNILWGLDEKKVCVHFAEQVLGMNGGKMRLEGFVAKLMKNEPKGMRFDLEMLQGEVLFEKIGAENWIKGFSVKDLPLSPFDRFKLLFKERAKWEWKDLEPYIRDLRVPGLSFEGILIKYTRRTQSSADAGPIFSAR
ncbi:hypothetical protein LUZ60_013732 [Juncus effusus]|nr:hypothetical protein LUZ60_013732 [Juncus effusus]